MVIDRREGVVLSFENFPWFRNAPVSAIHNVEFLNKRHLRWPDLNIDLAVESIEHPERFPLVANQTPESTGS